MIIKEYLIRNGLRIKINSIKTKRNYSTLKELSPFDSYVKGPETEELRNESLITYWKDKIITSKTKNKVAIISKREAANERNQKKEEGMDCLRMTYGEVDQMIDSIALSLLQLGVTKFDRVGINTANHSIYPLLQLATAKIGAILTCINPSYTTTELINVIDKVECKVLFSTLFNKTKDNSPKLLHLIQNSNSIQNLILINNQNQNENPTERFKLNFNENPKLILDLNEFLIHPPAHNLSQDSMDSNDIVNLQFTSGTTGIPKAVSLTHKNLLNNAIHIGRRINLNQNDLVCNVPPMFHCFGSVVGNLATLLNGATLVIPHEHFEPTSILRTISEEKCTVLNGVGTMFISEMNQLEKMKEGEVDLSSLRTGIIAGSPVSEELMNKIETKLGIKEMSILYGMTETSPATFQTEISDDPIKRKTTVGKIYPHTRAKIIDMKTNKITKRGESGDLLISGYSVQKGYWKDEIETNQAMSKDHLDQIWFKTGDIAMIDSEDYLKIVGRSKDVIIRGGENIYPVMIENCINKLSDVDEVAVIGIEDEFYGEVIGTFIKRKNNKIKEEDILFQVKSEMSNFNLPKYIWFLDLIGQDNFPMTESGKIKKKQLKNWIKDLNLI